MAAKQALLSELRRLVERDDHRGAVALCNKGVFATRERVRASPPLTLSLDPHPRLPPRSRGSRQRRR